MATERYDTVIVGGGSAGCVLAARLTEDPAHRVLLLEAGGGDPPWDLWIHMPAALSFPIGNPRYDWGYETDPEPEMGGRRVYHARGRVLGGSSSINGMIFLRGNPMDYEGWAQGPGLQSWGYADCLPYFKRSESRPGGDPAFRGSDGPLHLEVGPCRSPLFEAFFAAGEQAGLARSDDLNGHRQEGVGPFDRNIHRGRRWSAARAYLAPARGRPNLRVVTKALATGVRFEGTRATGVDALVRGRPERFDAGRVVLCGGAINSPQLLQLSGVGPADLLAEHGIDVVADRPVGENLQDHLEVYVQHRCTEPVSMQPALSLWRRPELGFRWLFLREGPAATNHFEGGGFLRSHDGAPYPDVQLHFLPLAIRYDGTAPKGGHGYQVHVGPMLSDCRGRVAIRSTDPREHPSLRFDYLSTEADRRQWIRAVRAARNILAQDALGAFDGGELNPGPQVETDEQILAWVRKDAETALHPSCTCPLGTGPDAVVDPDTFGVHGTEGLHVVDASVMPTITNANLYAPVMMIAERAADALRGDTLLPAEPVAFHRAAGES